MEKKSFLNVIVAVGFRVILFFGSFLTRRYLIRFLGNDINGINALYISLVGVLSVAELGIGDAITYCMYEPIAEKNTEKVSALFHLFRRIYIIIGVIIAVAGCGLMPFLPHLAKGYSSTDINLYLTFGLMLASSVLSYFSSAKLALINAYRDNYVATTITSVGQLLQQLLQIVVLKLTQSFVWYLSCRIIATLVQWGITNAVSSKKYSEIMNHPVEGIDSASKENVLKNVKSLFIHKIGYLMVNTLDSIIISTFIGVVMLGKYSNYTTIMTAMMGVIVLFFTPLTSSVGHLFVQDKEGFRQYYKFFTTLNFALGCLFFLGYYAVINALIALLFGEGLELARSVSFVITVNYFVQFMRQSTLTFRDASGTFYYDRWKPIAEGISNFVLSIIFVQVFQNIAGDDFAVVGVIVATIVTNLFICHIVEPFVLHKYALNTSAKNHYIRNYGYMLVFVILLIVENSIMVTRENKMVELITNGCISVAISAVVIVVLMFTNKQFKYYFMKIIYKIG